MTDLNRPHCRMPDACVAKSERHCRSCSAAMLQAQLRADPERVARRQQKSNEAHRTAESREKSRAKIKRQWECPGFRAAASKNARKQAAEMVNNVEIKRKRAESMSRVLSDPNVRRRRNQSLASTLALRLAARVGIPVELVPLFREIRDKVGASAEQAREVVLSSREASALAAQKATAQRLRDAGPAPAIGTPQRAAWTRKVHGIPQPMEAHPC